MKMARLPSCHLESVEIIFRAEISETDDFVLQNTVVEETDRRKHLDCQFLNEKWGFLSV
jgi:hypothetical protein